MADKDKEEKSKRINWNWIILGIIILAAFGAFGDRVEILVPVAGMLAVTIWIGLPFWLWHKRKLRKEELEIEHKAAAISSPEKDALFKRMQERVENLEAMMCNLDREINLQMEKSLRVTNMLASISNPAGV